MKIIIATDSFKGSLSSIEAGQCIKQAVKNVDASIDTIVYPLADGGEGTVETLVEGMNGTYQEIMVTGPLQKKVKARYGIVDQTAIIEMAQAAGITLITKEEQNPLITTTYGVGEIIKDAFMKGCRRFIIGIGGSVTNDGGVGMLQALGYEFLDDQGKPIPFGGQGLKKLTTINTTHVLKELQDCEFRIACDVQNPLCGPQGASAIYGPQKGATPDMVKELDHGLQHYANIVKSYDPSIDETKPGSGAAGGLGFAFYAFLKAKLISGIDLIIAETHLDEALKDADLVITGEGRLDHQTPLGKAPIGVAKWAKKYHVPVIAIGGSVSHEAKVCHEYGINALFPILREVVPLETAMEHSVARENLIDTIEEIIRFYQLIINKEDQNAIQ